MFILTNMKKEKKRDPNRSNEVLFYSYKISRLETR